MIELNFMISTKNCPTQYQGFSEDDCSHKQSLTEQNLPFVIIVSGDTFQAVPYRLLESQEPLALSTGPPNHLDFIQFCNDLVISVMHLQGVPQNMVHFRFSNYRCKKPSIFGSRYIFGNLVVLWTVEKCIKLSFQLYVSLRYSLFSKR